MTAAERQKAYCDRLNAKLREERGNKCQGDSCDERSGLEWAHIKPTEVRGWGRGRAKRLRDVRNNPDAYLLLCVECHSGLDQVNYNRGSDPSSGGAEENPEQEAIPF